MKDMAQAPNQPDESLPHSIEIEQQVLGAFLVNNDHFHTVSSLVKSDHFFDPVHARIFSHIKSRVSKDHIASPVTLKVDMESDDGLKELGGTGYLVKLAGASISAFAIADYCRELADLFDRRQLMEACHDALRRLSQSEPTADVASQMETSLQRRVELGLEQRSMSLLAAHTKSLNQMIEARETGEFGIQSGLKDLDNLIGGFRKGEVTLIAGATSMGKTSLGTFVACKSAQAGYGVGFPSLEMSEAALSQRICSMECEIPYKAMTRPLSEDDFRKVFEAAKEQEALPIQIFSDKVRDIPAILSECKRLRSFWVPNDPFKGLGMLVIDYIQLVRGKGKTNYEVLSGVARDLKAMAKLLDIPVIALAQIARDMSKRDSKIPHLGDLRGAGDLEDAADNVIFTHRPVYYLERQEPPKDIEARVDHEALITQSRDRMELYVAKQRMGPLGKVTVGCDMATNRFWDLDHQQEIEF